MTVQPLIPPSPAAPEVVSFDRQELGVILSLYGRMVAAGEWRDYGLSFLRERAVTRLRDCADFVSFKAVAMDCLSRL